MTMSETQGLSVHDRLGLDRLGEPGRGFAFTNADGDQVAVRSFDDGTLVTECANGTTTVHTPDGGSRSVNDPLGGAPIYVAVDPDGGRVTELPNGKTETVTLTATESLTETDRRFLHHAAS
jgi:DNA-binding beta-propeller fold protein YncE